MLLVGLIGICIGAIAGFYIINKVEDGKTLFVDVIDNKIDISVND